jgi:holliday junction DNA helicase RuvA
VIAQLTGTVARVATPYVILDVNGVGYRVAVPLSVIEALPDEKTASVTLITHLIVREDDLSLYGFLDELELRVFELLLTVQGVGPKVALALLTALGGAGLAQTVSSEDQRALTKVPGVGARTAQRLILELKEKLFTLGFERKVDQLGAKNTVKLKDTNAQLVEDVSSALVNLGYNKVDAQRATDNALIEALKSDSAPQFATLLRAALGKLS